MADEIKKTETVTSEAKPAKKPAAKKAKAPKAKAAKAPKAAKAKKTEEKELKVTGDYKTRPALIKDFSILKYVIVTEETQRLQAKENAMVFAVDKKATKDEIKAAVQAIFSAKVKSVNTMNVQPKTRRVGRFAGTLPTYKKAIVRFDSAFDLGKITAAVASEERKATPAPKAEEAKADVKTEVKTDKVETSEKK